MPPAFVVDTNVPIAANGKSHATPKCVITCIDALENARKNGIVVLDDAMLILDEYFSRLNMSGEPGPGDAFAKWVWNVQADENHCERVGVNPYQDNHGETFLEFPDDPQLANFDRRDRKFVAVARASQNHPTILNALDSDWADAYEALVSNGLTIDFLCPNHVHPPGP